MKRDFETILDESLAYLQEKESIEVCLGRYPQYAAQLEPLLRTFLKVEVLKDTDPPSAEAMAAGRERFLREAVRFRTERARAHKLARGLAGRTWILPLAVVALLAGLLLVVLASLLMLAVLIRLNASDVFHWPYRQWATPRPQPTMTQPATDTPWPTMAPREYQTPMAPLYPAESGTPTCTPTPVPTATPMPPTDTPVPTATPVPPTGTPVPTVTPVPPTDTPHPTDDHGGGHDDDDHDGGGHSGGSHDGGSQGSGGHDGGGHDGGGHGDKH